MFELITGRILFEAKTLEDMLHRIVNAAAPVPSTLPGGEWIPEELDDAVLGLLQKNPAKRPQTMAEVRRLFEKVRPAAERAWSAWYLPGGKGGVEAPRRHVGVTDGAQARPHVARARPLVLSIDDDRVIRGLVQTLVKSTGCDCEELESGEAALDWLRRNPPPDAVVCDLLMPGMDGLTLIDTARANGFLGPVVFCSSVVSARLREDTQAMGRAWCLDKAREMHRIPETLRLAGVAPPTGA
jgi:CheY-like chemotaxis protein